MLTRRLLVLGGAILWVWNLSAAPVFTVDSRKDEAYALSAAGGENEDKFDTLTDFSPGSQTHSISYFNAPFYSVSVTANATTAYTDTIYTFNTHGDTSTNIGVAGAGSQAYAKFESFTNFHLDQTTNVHIMGTITAVIPVNTNTVSADNSVIMQITDTNTNLDKYFTALHSSTPFDVTRTLPAGDYFFRLQTIANNSSTGGDTGTARATLDVTGTFAIPEPTALALAACSLPLLRRSARRRRM